MERDACVEVQENGDIEVVKESTGPSPYRYTKEELLEIKYFPICNERPDCLLEKFDSDGVWDPEKWHASLYSTSECSSPVDGYKKDFVDDRIPLKRRIADPRERLKEDDLDVVLSPQRRSFGGGCVGNALPAPSRRPVSPLENKENESLRLGVARRIGSGRIMAARGFEREREPRVEKERDFKDKRFRRDFGDKRVFSERRRNDLEEEPEWFSGGPTSQSETIELIGFDDKILEEDKRRPKRSRKRTDSVREVECNGGLAEEHVVRDSHSTADQEVPHPEVLPEQTSGDFDFNEFFNLEKTMPGLASVSPGQHCMFTVCLGAIRCALLYINFKYTMHWSVVGYTWSSHTLEVSFMMLSLGTFLWVSIPPVIPNLVSGINCVLCVFSRQTRMNRSPGPGPHPAGRNSPGNTVTSMLSPSFVPTSVIRKMYETKEKSRDEPGSRPDSKEGHSQGHSQEDSSSPSSFLDGMNGSGSQSGGVKTCSTPLSSHSQARQHPQEHPRPGSAGHHTPTLVSPRSVSPFPRPIYPVPLLSHGHVPMVRPALPQLHPSVLQRMLAQGIQPQQIGPALIQAGIFPQHVDLSQLQGLPSTLLGQPLYPLGATGHPLLLPRASNPMQLALMQQQLQQQQQRPMHPTVPGHQTQNHGPHRTNHSQQRVGSPPGVGGAGLAKWFGSDVLQQPLPSMPAKVISVDELEFGEG
uniref:Eukaryotic translation initiation factor 4E nuclear import factor 1 n=1 Tax=Oncorhynchus mykiss TaxID=8022 RepID=A0A8C7PDW4_ONCMY